MDTFDVIVLAGDRTANDPVAAATGAPCKAFAPVGGRPMVLRVLDALRASAAVGRITLCGPAETLLGTCPELHGMIRDGAIRWMAPGESPGRSARAALAAQEPEAPILLTTADHALLTPEIVDSFLEGVRGRDVDAALGLVDLVAVQRAFSGVRRTVYRMQDGQYCGCNLYALVSERGRELVDVWGRYEQERKRPARVVFGLLGWRGVAQYAGGRLGLEPALDRISRRLRIRIDAVILAQPEAGVDVDSEADLALARAVIEQRGSGSG